MWTLCMRAASLKTSLEKAMDDRTIQYYVTSNRGNANSCMHVIRTLQQLCAPLVCVYCDVIHSSSSPHAQYMQES
jgi:hypothetical protein